MTKSEDIFEARLRRLQDNKGAPAKNSGTINLDRAPEPSFGSKRSSKQTSVLLPIMSMILLLFGGAAFAVMMLIPDPSAGQQLASDRPLVAPIIE